MKYPIQKQKFKLERHIILFLTKDERNDLTFYFHIFCCWFLDGNSPDEKDRYCCFFTKTFRKIPCLIQFTRLGVTENAKIQVNKVGNGVLSHWQQKIKKLIPKMFLRINGMLRKLNSNLHTDI